MLSNLAALLLVLGFDTQTKDPPPVTAPERSEGKKRWVCRVEKIAVCYTIAGRVVFA